MERYTIFNRRLFWIAAAIMAWFGCDGARAQQRQPVTSVQPDCMISFNLSVASSGVQATAWLPNQAFPASAAGTSQVIDNHSPVCYGWTVAYANHGLSAVSLSLQSAPDNTAGTAPGTWSTVSVCAGTECLGINPNTSTTSAITTTKTMAPWLRVNLTSKTGTGAVVGVLYGFKVNIVANGGSPVVATVPGAPVNSYQYNNAGTFGGVAHALYDSATGTTTFDTTGSVIMQAHNAMGADGGINGGALDPGWDALLLDIEERVSNVGSFVAGVDLQLESDPTANGSHLYGLIFNTFSKSGNTKTFTDLSGVTGSASHNGTALVSNLAGGQFSATLNSGSATDIVGVSGFVASHSAGNVAAAYHFYAPKTTNDGGGTVAVSYGYYDAAENGETGVSNHYAFWADEQGVFRIRADNTFDAVYQAIPALYNPQFAKYTAGAANFERLVLGQWNGNVAEIGTEKGGTGTLRPLRLLGTQLEIMSGAFATLGTPANARELYCTDCTVTSGIDNTCAGSGTGALAQRVNGAWKCVI